MTWSYFPDAPLPQGLRTFWFSMETAIGTETLILSSRRGYNRRWFTQFILGLLAVALGFASLARASGVGTLLGLCVGAVLLRYLPSAPRCSSEQEALVAEVVGCQVRVDGKEGKEILPKEMRPMARHAAYWADRVRERFGVVQNRNADLMAVRRWITDEMQKDTTHAWKDLRVKDRVALQSLVTRLAILPTVWDLEVEEMARGALATALLARHKAAPK